MRDGPAPAVTVDLTPLFSASPQDREVVQVGGFEALMTEDGPFRALASRQLL